jgi:hypothetical protein
MTLLKFNGFEGYTDPYDQRDASDFISSIDRSNMIYGTGRNGGNSLKFTNSSFGTCQVHMSFDAIENTKVAILGFAMKMENFSASASTDILRFGNFDNTTGFVIVLDSSGNLNLRAYGITLFDSENYLINKNEWYYIEAKVKIHNTSGVCIVRINEQEVLNYSGDLYFSGDSYVHQLYFGFPHDCFMELDDFYIADDQGSVNNDFLGDIRIDAIYPDGAGNYSQFTPSTGNNYECVDETELDEADYVSNLTAGEKDSYTYVAVPTDLDDAGIIGLQIRNNAKRTAASSNIKIDPFIRTGSTDYSQTAYDLPDAIGMVETDIILDDPSDSNPWTQTKINACEFGMEVA